MITPKEELFLLHRVFNEIHRRVQGGYFQPDELKGIAAMQKMLKELGNISKQKMGEMKPLSAMIEANIEQAQRN